MLPGKLSTAICLIILTTATVPQSHGTDAPDQSQSMAAFTDPQSVPQDLAQLDYTLNHTHSFSGRFTQYNPDGSTDQGQIFLRRPGKLRIDYADPSPLLIVSDGVTLVQQDRALETSDRVPLASTPLHFFLRKKVNLAEDTEIIGLQKSPTEIRVTARDGNGEMEGSITMVFDAQTLAFRSWIITDAFGEQTRVMMSDLQYNADLDPRLFILRDDDRRDRRR
ncbi:MAG: outer membrane lipoprotein carrier protein LolA [Hyphomonadaceae bacterium]|nr:outer membrane lipoprotein carrier protein LolA [Hyphomonadaceae bacterium]MBC6413005.1 outer membrane lipoprotein carrier protein LolA [Hyphomonadaceae bacterium]